MRLYGLPAESQVMRWLASQTSDADTKPGSVDRDDDM